MEGEKSRSFTSAMSLAESGISRIPERYILPPSKRRNPNQNQQSNITLPVIDLAALHDDSLRPRLLEEMADVCRKSGFFQVINHGVSPSIMEYVLGSAFDFFKLPVEEKMLLMSNDVKKPVRYGTSLNHSKDDVHFWRDFLKHYSHPLSKWINSWPSNPPEYKGNMGKYAEAVRVLAIELMKTIFESLGLKPDYLKEEVEEGMQLMAVNCYPACPEPDLALGMPPHSDYGCLTILLQSCQGLEVMDKEENWMPVPAIDGALLVHVGDQLEILSNGRIKSVVHRAAVNSEKTRLSIASHHSLSINKKVGPAPELINEQHPKAYRESSFGDFLDFLSANDILKGQSFIQKSKMNACSMREGKLNG